MAPFISATSWIWVQRRVAQSFIVYYFAFVHKSCTIILSNLPLLLLLYTSQIAKTNFQDWTSTVPLPLILKSSPCFTQKTIKFNVDNLSEFLEVCCIDPFPRTVFKVLIFFKRYASQSSSWASMLYVEIIWHNPSVNFFQMS